MKKLITAAVILCMLALCACSPYSSHYSAIGFVHSNTSSNAFMSFYEFDGTMVFTLNADKSDKIVFTASLGSGELEVFIDNGSGKTSLLSLKSGDGINGTGGELSAGKVYIIVETNGKCSNGSLTFNLE